MTNAQKKYGYALHGVAFLVAILTGSYFAGAGIVSSAYWYYRCNEG